MFDIFLSKEQKLLKNLKKEYEKVKSTEIDITDPHIKALKVSEKEVVLKELTFLHNKVLEAFLKTPSNYLLNKYEYTERLDVMSPGIALFSETFMTNEEKTAIKQNEIKRLSYTAFLFQDYLDGKYSLNLRLAPFMNTNLAKKRKSHIEALISIESDRVGINLETEWMLCLLRSVQYQSTKIVVIQDCATITSTFKEQIKAIAAYTKKDILIYP